MKIIGIDPGIEKTGIGIIEVKGNKLELIFNKLIKTDSKLKVEERLALIFQELSLILELYKVEHAAVEALFFAKNLKTAINVSQARGVMLLALKLNNVSIFEYTPLQVKQALVGYGRADKNQVHSLVKIVLKIDELPKQDDVADGIAVALTHYQTYKTLSKIKGKI